MHLIVDEWCAILFIQHTRGANYNLACFNTPSTFVKFAIAGAPTTKLVLLYAMSCYALTNHQARVGEDGRKKFNFV